MQSSLVVLQGPKGSSKTEYKVELRKWFHVCVAMSPDSAVVYVDAGNASKPCPVTNLELLLNQGQLTLGGKPRSENCFLGEVAEAVSYAAVLKPDWIRKVKNGENITLPKSELIQQPVTTSLKRKIKYEVMKTKELYRVQPNVNLVYFSRSKIAKEVNNICQKFGGQLLDLRKETVEIRNYVADRLMSVNDVDIWVSTFEEEGVCQIASTSDSEIINATENCNNKQKFVCKIPPEVTYKYSDCTSKKWSTVTFFPEEYLFQTEYEDMIEYDSSERKLSIVDPFTNTKKLSTSRLDGLSSVIGRHELNNSRIFLLTKCTETQFTCTNGFCIPLDNVCNFEPDCTDFSDETHCDASQNMPDYYNKDLSGGNPLELSLEGYIDQIFDISMDDGTIKIDLELNAYWKDKRVVFHNIHQGVESRIKNEKAAEYWQPDILLSSVVSEDARKLSMQREPDIMSVTAEKEGFSSLFGSREGESI